MITQGFFVQICTRTFNMILTWFYFVVQFDQHFWIFSMVFDLFLVHIFGLFFFFFSFFFLLTMQSTSVGPGVVLNVLHNKKLNRKRKRLSKNNKKPKGADGMFPLVAKSLLIMDHFILERLLVRLCPFLANARWSCGACWACSCRALPNQSVTVMIFFENINWRN